MSYLTIYFAIGALFGTFMWFAVGRDRPENPVVPKHHTLIMLMLFWPIGVAIIVAHAFYSIYRRLQ